MAGAALQIGGEHNRMPRLVFQGFVHPLNVLRVAPENEKKARIEFAQAAQGLGQSFTLIKADGGRYQPVGQAVGHCPKIALRKAVDSGWGADF